MTATTHPSSLCASLAALFRAHRGEWLDGRELARVAGAYGWRTRISELRRPPYTMHIRNRQRRIARGDGSRFVVSEYAWLPHEGA